jgi:hypothetical protein
MFNFQGRLFTFGCSFTRYNWPTWADILGRKFSYYENWAQHGGGNQYIFNSLVEANQRNKFIKDDTVIIMWSGTDREDRYINGNWKTPGDVHRNRDYYSLDYLKKYADVQGYLIRDIATITATKDLLNYWGVNYHFLSLTPLTNMLDDKEDYEDIYKLYSRTFESICPSVFEIIYDRDWFSRKNGHNLINIIPTIDKIDEIIQDQIRKEYESLMGSDWPIFEEYTNKKLINNSIIKKELKNFNTRANTIKSQTKKEIKKLSDDLSYVTKELTRDLHLTPSEHLEYLSKIFPQWAIDKDTIDWTTQYNLKVMSNNRIEVMLNWNTHTPSIRL